MTDIDTNVLRARQASVCGFTNCEECSRIRMLCDEIDRLRAIMQRAIDHINDDDNQDEMSSDAQEWCADVTSILNKVMGPILDD